MKQRQREIYEEVGMPKVKYFLNGEDCCIIAYGQTGSGKTHTVLGRNSDGLAFSVVEDIFLKAK